MEEAEINPPSPWLVVVCFMLESNCQEEELGSFLCSQGWSCLWCSVELGAIEGLITALLLPQTSFDK